MMGWLFWGTMGSRIAGMVRTLGRLEQMLQTLLQQQAALAQAQSEMLAHLQRTENLIMASQADIDAITTSVNNLVASQQVLSGHVDSVDAALKEFIARNPGVDVTALAAAVATAQAADDAVDTHVQAIQTIITPAP